jgi:hypothetical protein
MFHRILNTNDSCKTLERSSKNRKPHRLTWCEKTSFVAKLPGCLAARLKSRKEMLVNLKTCGEIGTPTLGTSQWQVIRCDELRMTVHNCHTQLVTTQ